MKTTLGILKEIDKDWFRQNMRRFTWQAYHLFPETPNPQILDLGCGTGIPTIELALMSKGRITAVDIDKSSLAVLKEKATALNLTKQIKTVKGDFNKLRFPRGSFDIVWCEGAVSGIGFEKGLRIWRPYLKPAGFMVIHDEIKDYGKKLASIPSLGYEIINHFIILVADWLDNYFRPLEKRIRELKDKYAEKQEILDILEKEECEIDLFKRSPDDFASIFFILGKKEL
jgi:ubiquinone/menaquinone biosynthesis C-methylase UbiE